MTEKQLIGKLRELRQIKPNKEWVVLTKSQILGEEPKLGVFLFFQRMALAVLALVVIVAGAVIFVNYSSEPKITQEEAKEELTQLQEQVLVLQKTIDETIRETVKKIAEVDLETTDPENFKNIVVQARQIIKEAEKIENSFGVLGVKINIEELEAATDEITQKAIAKVNIEETIEVWENRAAFGALNQEEKELLSKMKELVGEKKYLEAWELFLTNQQN